MDKTTKAQKAVTVSEIGNRAIDTIKGKWILKPTRKTWLHTIDPKHDGAVRFSKTYVSICPEIDANTRLIRTGLTDTMARELEQELFLQPGTLSPYNKAYWSDFSLYVKVPADGLILDCDNVISDKIKYCFLKACSKVASSQTDAMENTLYEFVLTSHEIEASTGAAKFKLKRDAFNRYTEMSLDDQYDFLLVFEGGKYKVDRGHSADFLLDTMGKIVDEKPKAFLALIDDPNFKEHVFVKKCLSANLITKRGGKYQTLGGEELGETYEDLLISLRSPEMNTLKVSLLSKLENLSAK